MEQMMDQFRMPLLVGTTSCSHISATHDECGPVIDYTVIPASPPGRVWGGREKTGELGFNRHGFLVS